MADKVYSTFSKVIAFLVGFAIGLSLQLGYEVHGYKLVTSETEVIETTECTSAPSVDIIIPEIEETIPTESILEEQEETLTETTPVKEEEEAVIETIPTEPEPEPIPEPPAVDKEELEMLACVIYQEAGGDMHCDECRRRVADVVLNRIADDRFPDTMYEVLTQKDQYGRFHKTGIRWPSRAKKSVEAHAVKRAYRIAEEVLSGKHSDLYGNDYVWQATFKQSDDNVYCCGHYYGR